MRRVASVLLAVALAAAAVAVQAGRWNYERAYGPFAKHGRIGQEVSEPKFSVKVEQVESAHSVRIPADRFGTSKEQNVPAGGVFLSVIATVRARRSPAQTWTALLRTRYGDYAATDKFGGGAMSRPSVTTLNWVQLQPGMPRYGAYVFDVPPRALRGARLIVSDRDGEADFGHFRDDPERLSGEVQIDLDIDAARARRLTRAPVNGYEVPGPS